MKKYGKEKGGRKKTFIVFLLILVLFFPFSNFVKAIETGCCITGTGSFWSTEQQCKDYGGFWDGEITKEKCEGIEPTELICCKVNEQCRRITYHACVSSGGRKIGKYCHNGSAREKCNCFYKQNQIKKCYNNDIWDFDTCGNPVSKAEECNNGFVCRENENGPKCVDKRCCFNVTYDTKGFVKIEEKECLQSNSDNSFNQTYFDQNLNKKVKELGGVLHPGESICLYDLGQPNQKSFGDKGTENYLVKCSLSQGLIVEASEGRDKICTYDPEEKEAKWKNNPAEKCFNIYNRQKCQNTPGCEWLFDEEMEIEIGERGKIKGTYPEIIKNEIMYEERKHGEQEFPNSETDIAGFKEREGKAMCIPKVPTEEIEDKVGEYANARANVYTVEVALMPLADAWKCVAGDCEAGGNDIENTNVVTFFEFNESTNQAENGIGTGIIREALWFYYIIKRCKNLGGYPFFLGKKTFDFKDDDKYKYEPGDEFKCEYKKGEIEIGQWRGGCTSCPSNPENYPQNVGDNPNCKCNYRYIDKREKEVNDIFSSNYSLRNILEKINLSATTEENGSFAWEGIYDQTACVSYDFWCNPPERIGIEPNCEECKDANCCNTKKNCRWIPPSSPFFLGTCVLSSLPSPQEKQEWCASCHNPKCTRYKCESREGCYWHEEIQRCYYPEDIKPNLSFSFPEFNFKRKEGEVINIEVSINGNGISVNGNKGDALPPKNTFPITVTTTGEIAGENAGSEQPIETKCKVTFNEEAAYDFEHGMGQEDDDSNDNKAYDTGTKVMIDDKWGTTHTLTLQTDTNAADRELPLNFFVVCKSFTDTKSPIYNISFNLARYDGMPPWIVMVWVNEIKQENDVHSPTKYGFYMPYNSTNATIILGLSEKATCYYRIGGEYKEGENTYGLQVENIGYSPPLPPVQGANWSIDWEWPENDEIKIHFKCVDESGNENSIEKECINCFLWLRRIKLSMENYIFPEPENGTICLGPKDSLSVEIITSSNMDQILLKEEECKVRLNNKEKTMREEVVEEGEEGKSYYKTEIGMCKGGTEEACWSQGSQNLEIECCEIPRIGYGLESCFSQNVLFNIKLDNKPPRILTMYVEGDSLIIKTNEEANCYYSFEKCPSESKETKKCEAVKIEKGVQIHSCPLELKTYHLECVDKYQNKGECVKIRPI